MKPPGLHPDQLSNHDFFFPSCSEEHPQSCRGAEFRVQSVSSAASKGLPLLFWECVERMSHALVYLSVPAFASFQNNPEKAAALVFSSVPPVEPLFSCSSPSPPFLFAFYFISSLDHVIFSKPKEGPSVAGWHQALPS